MVNAGLSTELLRRLEQLQLVARRYAKSPLRGERASRARGHSVEFADYRDYVSGDDLRYLDWSLYGRLDRLFIRLYEEERELPVTLFLDASESMSFGEPRKFDFARQIVAAVAHVALCGFDRVSVRVFPDREVNRKAQLAISNVRGRQSSLRLIRHLNQLVAGERGELNEALRQGAIESKRVGLAIVVSDLLDESGYRDGLKALVARGFQVIVVQILSPEELHPSTFGDLRVVDAETGTVREVTFGKFRRRRYRTAVRAYIDQVAEFCSARGVAFWSVTSDSLIEDLLLRQMKEGEFWR